MQSRPCILDSLPTDDESPLKDRVDRILVVDCDEEVQLERLLSRDIESAEQGRRIIEAQTSRDKRLALADDVISNNSDIDHARRQITGLHRKYLSLASDG